MFANFITPAACRSYRARGSPALSVDIAWTRSTRHLVSVRLDTFVGPKERAVPWTDVHYTP